MRSVLVVATWIALAAPAWAADVPEVYNKKCALCHSVGGVGGAKKEVGGPIDGVGSKRDEAWLRAYIKDPKSAMPEAKMPKMPLTEAEHEAVIAYMLSLK